MTDAAADNNGKSPEAYRTIGEVAEMLGVAQHVLRFWESRFAQLKPVKMAGNRRHYRPVDVALIRRIRELLYDEGYSIRGVQKLLKVSGVTAVAEGGKPATAPVAPATSACPVTPVADRDKFRAILGELQEIRDLLR